MDRGTGLVTLRFILYGDFGGTRPGERLLGSLWLVITDGSSGRNGLSRQISTKSTSNSGFLLCLLTGCV
jgi:hypothetical protein